MKNIILVALLIMSPCLISVIHAQTPSDSTKTSKFVYCELIGVPKLLSTNVSVYIDYGEQTKNFQDSKMKDVQTLKLRTFNSMVDALNYMGNNGWEFVQAYLVPQNIYHWLLKKKNDQTTSRF